MSLLIRIVGCILSGIVISFANKGLSGGWRKITGEEPPKPTDLEVPVRKSLLWTFAGVVVVTAIEVFSARIGAKARKSLSGK